MLPSEVNNTARAMQGALRREHDRIVAGTLSLPYLPLAGGALTGAVTATSITASGTLQGATLVSTGNIHLTGAYIFLASGTGAVNTTGGPLLYADTVNHVYKVGSGDGSFYFQNYAGTTAAIISSAGNYSQNGDTITINNANSPRVVLHNSTDGTYKGIASSNNVLEFTQMNSGGAITAAYGYFDVSSNFFAGGNISTVGGTVAGAQIEATGTGAITLFQQRDNLSIAWGFYATGNIARWWNSSTGDRMTIDLSGNATIIGTLNSAGFATAGTVTGGFITSTGNVNADNAVTSPTVTCSGAMTAGTLTLPDGTGNITCWDVHAHGSVFTQQVVASSTVTAAQLTSTGNINAASTVAAAQLTSTGNINATNDIGCRDIYLRDVNSTGNISLPGTVTAGYVTSAGNVNADNAVTTPYVHAGAAGVLSDGNIATPGAIQGATLRSTGTLQVDSTSALLGTTTFGPAGAWARIDTNGTYNVTGSWLTLSDRAVKDNITPYTRGLAAILALNPVTYVYKAGSSFADASRTVRLGLVAQDVAVVMPELVGTAKSAGADVATLAPGNLVYALINAVKELTARVAVLEAAKV